MSPCAPALGRWARIGRFLAWLGLAGLILLGGLIGLELGAPAAPAAPASARVEATPALIAQGAYLARAGNCAACHTRRGDPPYAGGRAIETPFGPVFGGNLTPSGSTGLGHWQADDFWRALHEGRSRDGRLLVPAFPYPHFTQITRTDSDALWAYLRSLPAVDAPATPHRLRWPFGTQAALALWRVFYFRPSPGLALGRPGDLDRGAYLVEGLGHCSACHGPRNAAGAGMSVAQAAGLAPGPGYLPVDGWIAPSLTDPAHPGVAGRAADELVQLLQTGVSSQAAVMGPMAEVVAGSTQHLQPQDLRAMVNYLQSLVPAAQGPVRPAGRRPDPAPEAAMSSGARLYTRHCADCHGSQGQGVAGVYPALAGNRSVTMDPPRNLLQAITRGGFPPGTAGNPRPYGMPAYDLSHEELAALATWLRAAWGHAAPAVTAVDVLKLR